MKKIPKNIKEKDFRELVARTVKAWEDILGTEKEDIAFIRGWKLGFESSLSIFEELIGK